MTEHTGSIFPVQPATGSLSDGEAQSEAYPSADALRSYATLLRGVLDEIPLAVAVVEDSGRLALWSEELDALVPQPRAPRAHRDLDGLIRSLRRIAVDPAELRAAARLGTQRRGRRAAVRGCAARRRRAR